jgi:heparan-alpha-glucosaminide N-acetyltransferase
MQLADKVTAVPAASAPPSPASQRYLALDAYRGFIMLMLASGGFGFAALAKERPAFAFIAAQFEHRQWEWIAFWDLIQPAFMFMVGVAMPFALAIRKQQGATDSELFKHAVWRSLRLILMSQILMSIARGRLHFQMINVLAQIGLTYFLCFLIMRLKFAWQAAIAVLILVGHWALFVAFPGTGHHPLRCMDWPVAPDRKVARRKAADHTDGRRGMPRTWRLDPPLESDH